MIDSEQHPYVESIVRDARRPVRTDQAARDRIMAAVRAEPLPERQQPHIWERVFEARTLRLSPAGSALIAAGLVGIGVLAGTFAHNRDVRSQDGPSQMAVVPQSQLPVSDSAVKFVFVAPQAGRVSVVGDFNGWDSTKTPMVREPHGGVWTVELPLSAGRHLYSFVVDGSWSADPSAPLAPDEGFGHANSVKVVREGSAL
jgi:hypothetical protein